MVKLTEDFKLFVKPINKSKASLRSHTQISEQKTIQFYSYKESIKNLTCEMTQKQKQKLSKFFTPSSLSQNSQQRKSQQIKSNSFFNSLSNSSNNQKSSKSPYRQNNQMFSNNFISEVMFESSKNQYIEIETNYNTIKVREDDELKQQQFTHEERQSLKNAFRYICRLIFKQANKYSQRMNLIDVQNKKKQLNTQKRQKQKNIKKNRSSYNKSSISTYQPSLSQLNLSQQAQLISGQRYFKQYLQKLQTKQKQLLLKYMIWFLRTKYLRYINKCNNQNKGKRKQMKKDLYIRFKNTTMLPYLEGLLIQTIEKHNT